MARLVLAVDVVDGRPVLTGWERPGLASYAIYCGGSDRSVESDVSRLLAGLVPAPVPRSYSHWGMFYG